MRLRMKSQRRLKGLLITIGIIIVALLLVNVLIVALQFKKEGKDIDLTEETPQVEENNPIVLTNISDYTEEEIKDIINEKRNDLIAFFNEAKYYNISEVDNSYTQEDNEEFMAIDDEFLAKLHNYVTDGLFEKLTANIEPLKTVGNKIFYKSPRKAFDSLYFESAIATLDTNNLEIHPSYATNEEIRSIVNIQICEENEFNLCRRDDAYTFNLINIDEKWLIDDILTKKVDK